MVTAKWIHHMTLVVNDADQSRDFFARILGLPEIKKPKEDMSVVWFGIEANEFYCMVRPDYVDGERSDMSLNSRGRGFENRHLALTVSDSLDEVARVFKAEDIPYHRGTAGLPQKFCEDSSGNFIEINTGWFQAPL